MVGEGGVFKEPSFGRQLLDLLCCALPYSWGDFAAQRLSSCPHHWQNQAPPASQAKSASASVNLDYCSITCSFGELVSVLLLNLAAEAEPDLNWGNFDGLEHWMESSGCHKVIFKFKVLEHR